MQLDRRSNCMYMRPDRLITLQVHATAVAYWKISNVQDHCVEGQRLTLKRARLHCCATARWRLRASRSSAGGK